MDQITVIGIKGPVKFKVNQMIDMQGIWFSVAEVKQSAESKQIVLEVSSIDEEECRKHFLAGHSHDGVGLVEPEFSNIPRS